MATNETHRQLVHLSGLLFVLLAQVTGPVLASAYFFMIALTLLAYSEYTLRQQKRLAGLMDRLESKVRNIALKLERKDTPRPFMGAFWFYAGSGLAFLFFPLSIASAACLMLAVGDSFSTLVGLRYGRHIISGKKSLEGSLALFFSSFLVSLFFVAYPVAFLGALGAVMAEILPDMKAVEKLKKKSLIDDNYLIPIVSGIIMLLASF